MERQNTRYKDLEQFLTILVVAMLALFVFYLMMAAGGKMGMQLIPVMTGHGRETINEDRLQWQEFEPVYVAQDLHDAVKWIVRKLQKEDK